MDWFEMSALKDAHLLKHKGCQGVVHRVDVNVAVLPTNNDGGIVQRNTGGESHVRQGD